MTTNEAYAKIKDSLPQIFAYALKRTNNRHEAEDLSQEILLNLFSAVPTIRDGNTFYGWMWAVAGNVFKAYLRKKAKSAVPVDELEAIAPMEKQPQNEVVANEELGLLYRELSILSGLYRETTVLYYVKEHSCEEISRILNISEDMVKQYLFKARKKVKEGMGQIRERGERSFNPKKFNVYFWGEGANKPELFTRKLPGNVLLEAYYAPITVEELGVELGVASVYLEDEINILLKNDLLKQVGNKVQANIIIFTQEYEVELTDKTQAAYKLLSDFISEFLSKKEPDIRRVGFKGADMTQNALRWQMATMALTETATKRFLGELVNDYPTLSDGTSGYLWGVERQFGDNNFDPGIHRYTDRRESNISLVDFAILGKQRYTMCKKPAADIVLKIARGEGAELNDTEREAVPELIKDAHVLENKGQLTLPLPIYTSRQLAEVRAILKPVEDKVLEVSKSILPITEKLLQNYVPATLRRHIPVLACLKQVENIIVQTMEMLYVDGFIKVKIPSPELLTAYVELKE